MNQSRPVRLPRERNAPAARFRRVLGAAALAVPLLAVAGVAALPGTSGAVTPAIALNQVWSRTGLPDAGSPIALSSPNIASIAGQPAVVVGDRVGYVWAFLLGSGATLNGWPFHAGAPVDSTPSVDPTTGTIFVGSGNAASPYGGNYQAITPTQPPGDLWAVRAANPSTDPNPYNGVQAGLAVGNLQGGEDVVAGSLGENEYALTNGGAVLGGFPWYQADSNFTTPAIADLYGTSQNQIIEGGDSSAGVSYLMTYQNGGHLRVLSPTGNAYTGSPSGGLICSVNYTQTIQSSPAVGEFLGGSTVGIVFGTGNTFTSSQTNQVIATDSHCNSRWATTLDGSTATESPALADVLGNGQLQVVEGTTGGTVYVLNGSNGSVAWQAQTAGPVIGSVVTADLGAGYQDLIVPTTNGVQIFDGKSGALLGTMASGYAFQNAPLVTDDANGTIGITMAGYGSTNQGAVFHYEVAGSTGSKANETGAWPMFHHDPQLTGDAGTPPPVVNVPCNAPSATPSGFYLTGTDGGVFNFGNLPFCGSTGNITLNQPVVGIATTHNAGGYWLVARDGGIFAFGNAATYGSLPGIGVHVTNAVGIAATNDGNGYWVVASDGGIFTFGDAPFLGSMGGQHLNEPIVGMARDPATGGYWEVASDGGIFTFDAPFLGSMGNKHLNQPIVGIAAAPGGNGYWEVASDGGIFTFGPGATFYGSTGAIHLDQPIIGIAPTPSGAGYWLTAADGGVFAFGTAPFYGSLPGSGVVVRNITAVAGAP